MVSDRDEGRFDETRSFKTLAPGTVISHYKIIEKIGEGGMGVVYKAQDTKLERSVALKFLPGHLLCDPEAKDRFEHEAKAASALSHANITTIHEIDEADGRCFIVMEYVGGKTIRGVIGEKDIAVGDILDIAIQIGKGLASAHKHGVFHRDIKADNIKVTPDGTAKIMDFGLAKLKDATKVTKPGTTLGTLPYMSPEQVQGRDLDQRSDIFSLGVVLYEIITGRLPFVSDSEQGMIYSILNDTPDPLARFKSGLPEGIQHIVDKALAKDKRERYQHVDEMVADLMHEKRLLESSTLVSAGIRTPPRSRRKLLRILLTVTAVAAAILLIFIFEPFRLEMGPREEAAAQENSLAVMYFENMPDPEDTDKTARMMTALLITDLSESDYMYVISRQRLYDILKLLGKEDLKAVDHTVASEVAEKAGVKWMLTGSILQMDPTWVVTADISETSTGKILATQRIAADKGEDIFALVDRLSAAIKADLSLPEAAGEEPDRPVADVTTHSPEAYRYYLEGTDAAWKFYWQDARQSLAKALEYDSTFAMAYYRLGGLSFGEERLMYAAKGLEFADRASNREQYYLKGFHTYASGDYAGAAAMLEEALRKYPDDKEMLYTLGYIYDFDLHRFDRAIEHYTRAIEIDPMYKIAYNTLAYAYHYTGDFDKSIWAINKYIALAPDEANPYDTRGDLYAFQGNLDDAIESYTEAVRIKPDFWGSQEKVGYMYLFKREYDEAEAWFRRYAGSASSSTRSLARYDLALIPTHQGRFEEALRVIDDGLAADRMDGYDGIYKALKQGLKSEIYTIKGEFDSAEAEVRLFCDMSREATPGNIVYYRYLHALRLARAGRFDEAEEMADAIKRDIDAAGRPDVMNEYWNARAFIEMVRGNADAAISYFEKARDIDPTPYFHNDIRRGQAYLEADRLAEAVAILEGALSRYDEDRASNPAFSVRTRYFLGRAYEESGWRDKAVEQYRVLLDTWKDADPGIPVVEETRRRLAGL
jgi:serine/threonine protein kinase/tetratricopeptide (TPR) repeat protein